MELIWVGNKQSDIHYCDSIFSKTVNLYGINSDHDICYTDKRVNNNIIDTSTDAFIERTLLRLINLTPNSMIMFYNPRKAYKFPSEILKRTLCLNDIYILDILNNKITCHEFFRGIVKFPPYITLYGIDISMGKLKQLFPTCKSFVIQIPNSAGGLGTFVMRDNNEDIIKHLIKNNCKYLVSEYMQDSISFNVHVIISNDTYVVFPPSIQLLCSTDVNIIFRGSDFINTEEIDTIQLEENIRIITEKLIVHGYKGILGIDFIQTQKNKEIKLIELNCRFQGSSFLLNLALHDCKLPSLQELTLRVFNGENDIILPSFFKVPYGAVIYYKKSDTELIIRNAKITSIENDGLSSYKYIEDYAYLYKQIYRAY